MSIIQSLTTLSPLVTETGGDATTVSPTSHHTDLSNFQPDLNASHCCVTLINLVTFYFGFSIL